MKFKIGDRVVMTDRSLDGYGQAPDNRIGTTATITLVGNTDGDEWVGVKWDDNDDGEGDNLVWIAKRFDLVVLPEVGDRVKLTNVDFNGGKFPRSLGDMGTVFKMEEQEDRAWVKWDDGDRRATSLKPSRLTVIKSAPESEKPTVRDSVYETVGKFIADAIFQEKMTNAIADELNKTFNIK